MDKEVINCSCNTHSIHVSYDEDFNEVAMSFWQCGLQSYKLSWKDRLKILFKGNLYSEMVFLNKEESNKLLGAIFLASEKIYEEIDRQTLERIAKQINENLQNKS